MTEPDQTDREILELLTADARRTLSDIAARVSLSAPAVKRRIERLEQAGIIEGYTVRIDHARLGAPMEALTELRFAGSTRVEEIRRIATSLPEVRALFTTAGDPDAVAWLRVRDGRDLRRVVDELRRSGQVTGTKTLMVLEKWTRSDHVIPD
jgi:DNA-binding Lrp family transcriptional regulator